MGGLKTQSLEWGDNTVLAAGCDRQQHGDTMLERICSQAVSEI